MSQSDTVLAPEDARSGCQCRPDPAVRVGPVAPMPAAPAVLPAQSAPGRHHPATTAWPVLGPDLGRAVYAVRDCVIRAMTHGEGLVIRLDGVPDAVGVAALGDCLVGALDQDVRSIRIAVETRGQRLPLAFESLLESLARLATRQGGRPGLSIVGEEPAASLLTRAVVRGRSQAGRKSRPTGDRP